MSVLEVILGLIFCIGALIWWWQRSARLHWEKNGVSYIPGPPFIGALKDCLTMKKSFGELFLDFYTNKKFKDDPITGFYFFYKPSLVIRHPELIKNILVKDFTNFMDRGANSGTHDTIGRDSLFVVKGQRWKSIRQKISPVLTTGKLKNFFLLMVDVSKALDEKLLTEIQSESREYEVKELAAFFTIDAIAISAFSVKANSLLNPNGEFYKNAKKCFDFHWKRAIEAATCFFLPELAILFRMKMFSKETNEFLRSSINFVIQERIRSGIKRNDLIDVLISMNEEDPELFKGDTLVAQAAAFLLAGYETASSVISFALYELARQPEIQEKLRKEIKDYLKKYESVQYETINEMEYLNCVVQETLRLYPAVPVLDRICTPPEGADSYSLDPYHKFAIPRGMFVYIPLFAIHRDPKFYPNPLEFIPERFSSENRNSINQYTYLAFGIGPRNCIGSRFGYLQVKLALITILRNYRIQATERTPKFIEFDQKSVFTQSKKPLYMNMPANSDPHEDIIGRDNLFVVKGLRWKTIRAKVSPVFTVGKLKNFFLLMVDVTKILEQKLQTEIGNEPKEYEMKEFASLFTTDTIALCAFGVQANSLLNPKADFHVNVKKTFEVNWKRAFQLASCFFLPELATLLRFTFFSKETNEFIRSSINYVMEERIKSGSKRNDLIDALIAMREEDSELFKGDTLVAQAAVFLLAGHETTSSALSFVLYELARHQEIQEKVRKEIKEYMEKYGSVQYETIHEMEYLHCVVQEAVRLYPHLPFLDRVCSPPDGEENYSLEPYHSFAIPKGMTVYIPVIAIHRDENFFPNPEEFIPERFSRENRDSINQYSFLSFGIGPRNCIGSRFGYLQAKLTLITILNNYRVEATERTPKTIEFDRKALVLHSKEPLYMNLTRLSQD
ncbi:probable cytochrome P450 6g2 [Lutzomyia longipalpis]|uniref:probable cytochrome P450 6g2 n=1 Tax=Lutzomyia longipalpis TaxID=7200 RepID=UPI00248439CE|nr:probable cytochrome P450 6g2 [Lutzomyia longipalpis]